METYSTVYLATDLNPAATLCTKLTGEANAVHLSPVLTNLTSGLLPRLEGSVDVLIFNPPYVETATEEREHAQEGFHTGEERNGIDKAWAGGIAGMEVTEKVLEMVEVSRDLPSLPQRPSQRPMLGIAFRERTILPRHDPSE